MQPYLRYLISLAACNAMLVGGCPAPSENAVTAADVPVSYAVDVQPIFDAKCVLCHQPGGFATLSGIPLDLRSDVALSELRNQASVQDESLIFVVPNDVAVSFLFDKVANETPAIGTQMPQNAALTEAEIDVIRRWIETGAEP